MTGQRWRELASTRNSQPWFLENRGPRGSPGLGPGTEKGSVERPMGSDGACGFVTRAGPPLTVQFQRSDHSQLRGRHWGNLEGGRGETLPRSSFPVNPQLIKNKTLAKDQRKEDTHSRLDV